MSKSTRDLIIDCATDVFAEVGFDGASVRTITKRAAVNQAAISYHFGSKEALYAEVLLAAVAALDNASPLNGELIDQLERDDAVRLFVRVQLASLTKQSELGRYVKIFAWETLQGTDVYRNVRSGLQIPIVRQAEKIVKRYIPNATPTEVAINTIWLTQQVAPFVRLYGTLTKPPLNFQFDEKFIDKLSVELGAMAVAGLTARMRLGGGGKLIASGG